MWKFYCYKGSGEPPHAIIRPCGFQRLLASTAVWLSVNLRLKRGMGLAQRVYEAAFVLQTLNRCSGSSLTGLVDELFMGNVLMQPQEIKVWALSLFIGAFYRGLLLYWEDHLPYFNLRKSFFLPYTNVSIVSIIKVQQMTTCKYIFVSFS